MNLKKYLAVLLVLCCAGTVFAEMNVSTCAMIESQKSGGGIGFGFPIFKKNNFFIRDEANINLYFSNTPLSGGKMVSVGDKLFFGSLKEINGFNFRSYGYCKFEAGACFDGGYTMFAGAPVVIEAGGAGGFEFLYSPAKSFFVEFGGGAAIHSWGDVSLEEYAAGSFKGGYVCLTAGAKYYF